MVIWYRFVDTVLHTRVVHGNLLNMLISTDQSQRVSQPVSQITLSQFRVSHTVTVNTTSAPSATSLS